MNQRFRSSVSRFLVTYPRSGHHLVEGMIERAFAQHGSDYSYCEYYNCCRTSPCRFGKKLQGLHDFDLDLDIDPGRAVVLYRRDPVLQLDAWFRWRFGKRSGEYGHLLEQDGSWWEGPTYERRLARFVASHREHYTAFVEKWIQSASPNVISFDYYEIVARPREVLSEILVHLFFDQVFVAEKLETMDFTGIRVINQMPGLLHEKISRLWCEGE